MSFRLKRFEGNVIFSAPIQYKCLKILVTIPVANGITLVPGITRSVFALRLRR